MFYEDIRIGESTNLGSTTFTRAAIVGYARDFDPRVLARERGGEILAASGLHVAAAAMRRLIETRKAMRAALAARGESLPDLGVSPGFREMRWPNPVHEGDVVAFTMKTVSKRETSKPLWGLVAHTIRGFNQRSEEVLGFSGVAFVARRTGQM